MAVASFHCDASSSIGAGHVMRCLAFAETLHWAGWSPTFVTSQEAIRTVSAISASGYNVEFSGFEMAASKASLSIVDGYEYGIEIERGLRRLDRRIAVFEDLPNRTHDCDMLIDPTPFRSAEEYEGLVPEQCEIFVGSQYAMIRRSWRRFRSQSLARISRGGPVERVLVSMGATDPHNATERVLKAIASLNAAFHVDVVLSSVAPHLARIAAYASDKIKLHVDPNSYPELCASADLAVGAPGSSSFERCVLGIPSVLIPTADNQKDLALSLNRAGAAEVLPVAAPEDEIAKCVGNLVSDSALRMAFSTASELLCDGRGTERLLVAQVGAVETGGGLLTLRLAESGDEHWLLQLQQEPTTRAFSRTTDAPTADEHHLWLTRLFNNTDKLLAIASTPHGPVAMVRLDKIDNKRFEISIAVDPQYRGEGVGKAALDLVARIVPQCELLATVHPENFASLALFQSAGYEQVGTDTFIRWGVND